MAKSQLHEMRSLEKEGARLKRIVADPELDTPILKETLDYLKSKARQDDEALRLASIQRSKQNGRYGYRKVVKLLGVEGCNVNYKKVAACGEGKICNSWYAINAARRLGLDKFPRGF